MKIRAEQLMSENAREAELLIAAGSYSSVSKLLLDKRRG
jgi:hypothetical protein